MALIADLVAKLKLDSTQFKAGLIAAAEETSSFASKAKLGLMSVAGILAGAVTGGFFALKSIISESVEKMDDLAHSSERLGIGVEAMQRLGYAAKLAGVSGEQLNTTLKFMEKNIGNIAGGTLGSSAIVGKYFTEMGISMKDIMNLPIEEQFNVIIKGLGNIENQDKRAAAATGIFGRGGLIALSLVKEGVSDAEKQFDSFGTALSGKQVASVHKFGKEIIALNALWGGFKNQLTAAVVPALENLITWIMNSTKSMGGMGAVAKIAAQDIAIGFKGAFIVLKGLENAVNIVIIAFDALAATALQTFRVATLGIADLTTNIAKTQHGFELDAVNRGRSILGLGPQAQTFSPLNSGAKSGGSNQQVGVTVKVDAAEGFIARVVHSIENQRQISAQVEKQFGNASTAHQ